MSSRSRAPGATPSLRGRLLTFLLVPVLLVLVGDALLTYAGALAYSNSIHDKDLSDSAVTLATMESSHGLAGDIAPQARFLLEFDPDGRTFFTIDSSKRGRLDQNEDIPPNAIVPAVGAAPRLYDTMHRRRPLRAAVMRVPSADDPSDILTIQVAETLKGRRQRAGEILLLTVPLQSLLILAILCLVWFGVTHGLRVLDPLTARLARREHDLGPIGDTDVPVEILPLTRTIDGLFARLRGVFVLQERFIADAAHQLRTPLAGLRMHVERAQANRSPEAMADAFEHIERLTARASRASTQLLSLTRAQSPNSDHTPLMDIDLQKAVPGMVGQRIHDAIAAGVDLGFEGGDQPRVVRGDALMLQEMLDNLIDNAIAHAGRGSSVTVGVAADPAGGSQLIVEDNGPGVPDEWLSRLGERFFRAPTAREGGTGLGLAIVERIADVHAANVRFSHARGGGLRVEIVFPVAIER